MSYLSAVWSTKWKTAFWKWMSTCPEMPVCEAGDSILTVPSVPLAELIQMQRLLIFTVVLSAAAVIILMHILMARPGVMYKKSDLDAFSNELFQGIYSAIEQLEVATADQKAQQADAAADPVTATAADADVKDTTGEKAELSEILSSLKHLETNQTVIAEALSKVLQMWKKLDDSDDFELATGTVGGRSLDSGSDAAPEMPDMDTILNTSDSILVADMDTSDEFEEDSFS